MTYSLLRRLLPFIAFLLLSLPVSAQKFGGLGRADKIEAGASRDKTDKAESRDHGPRDSGGGFDRDRSRDKSDASRDTGNTSGGTGGFDRDRSRDRDKGGFDRSRDVADKGPRDKGYGFDRTRSRDIAETKSDRRGVDLLGRFDRRDVTGSIDRKDHSFKDRFEALRGDRRDIDAGSRKRDWNNRRDNDWDGNDRSKRDRNQIADRRRDDNRYGDRRWHGGGWHHGHGYGRWHEKTKPYTPEGYERLPNYWNEAPSNDAAYLEEIIAQNEEEIARAYRLLAKTRDRNMRNYLQYAISARIAQNERIQARINKSRT